MLKYKLFNESLSQFGCNLDDTLEVILSFSESCKNQGSFCKYLIINKVLFLYLTEHGGCYENVLQLLRTKQ